MFPLNVSNIRAKKLPQSTLLVPRAGIDLLKDGVVFSPVGAADFRVNEIPFDMIFKTVRLMTAKLPICERNSILEKWDRLRDAMENMERRRKYLPKMDVTAFPVYVPHELPELDDTLAEPLDEAVIRGNVRDEAVEEGEVDEITLG